MGLIEECSENFGTECLYEVLSVEKTATKAQLKKAYKKAALCLHPDKVDESQKEEATKKFQTLSKIHFILSDPGKRAEYDETGIVEDEMTVVENESADFWQEYWRALFPKITLKDIDNFMDSYTGSEEEKKDLKECYVKYEGDMDMISETFIGYNVDDEGRLRKILNDMIKNGEIEDFPNFTKEAPEVKKSRKKKFKKEASEAEEMGGTESLINAMAKRAQDRQKGFEAMISNLEAKYGGKEPKGRRKKKA